jgi:drug/metabolite transporter (DMT)-like permease
VNPLIYIYLVSVAAAIFLTPYMAAKKKNLIAKEWAFNKTKIIAVSIMLAAAYYIVLVSMTTSKVSYVSSVREVSIVFVTIIGTLIFKESFALRKIMGSVLIFAGILFIALAK